MNEFDQFVKHELKVENYARYTDDFVIVSNDRLYLEKLLLELKKFLKERLLLELHPRKVEVRNHTKGIDFLGYVALRYHIDLRTKTKRRLIRKLRERVKAYKSGSITEAQLFGSLNSYLGVLSHANTHELRIEIESLFWYWLKE